MWPTDLSIRALNMVGEKMAEIGVQQAQSLTAQAIRRFRRNRVAVVGLGMLLAILLVSVFAPALTRHDPYQMKMRDRVSKPTAQYLLGTDGFGRDLYTRVLYGGRVSMRIAFLTVAFTTAAGIALGLVAGYFSWGDLLIMRVLEGMMAFPSILLALATVAVLGPQEINVVIALFFVYAPRTARIVRASVIQLKESDFVEAARSLGAGDARILIRHILPNAVSPIIVQATFIFAYAILAEAALSFIGVGTPPPTPSWGNIMAEGKQLLRSAPWVAFFPGVAIMLTVMATNLVGDALRDAFDPKLKNSTE